MTDNTNTLDAGREAEVRKLTEMAWLFAALGGPTVEEVDNFKAALRTQLATTAPARVVDQGAPVDWEYRWLNPDNYSNPVPSMLAWVKIEPAFNQTVQNKVEELQAYTYKGKPCYEVRALYTHAAPSVITPDAPSTAPKALVAEMIRISTHFAHAAMQDPMAICGTAYKQMEGEFEAALAQPVSTALVVDAVTHKNVPKLSTAAMNDAGLAALVRRQRALCLTRSPIWSDAEACFMAMVEAAPEVPSNNVSEFINEVINDTTLDAPLRAWAASLATPLNAPAQQTAEPVAVVDECDEGLFVEILYGKNGSALKRGDKLYTEPHADEVRLELLIDLRDALALCHVWSDPDSEDDSGVFPILQVNRVLKTADDFLNGLEDIKANGAQGEQGDDNYQKKNDDLHRLGRSAGK